MASIQAYQHDYPQEWVKYDGTNASEVASVMTGNGTVAYVDVPNSDDIILWNTSYPDSQVMYLRVDYWPDRNNWGASYSDSTFSQLFTVVE